MWMLPIFYLKISLNDGVGYYFLLLIFNEDIEELNVPVVGGGEDVPRGVGAGRQRQQLRGHRFALFTRCYKVFGTLLFLITEHNTL